MADKKTVRLPANNQAAPTKMKQLERLEKGARANTGGDHFDRSRGKYSKKREGEIPEFMED